MSYRRPAPRWRCTGCGVHLPAVLHALAHVFRAAWAHWVRGEDESDCWMVFDGRRDIRLV